MTRCSSCDDKGWTEGWQGSSASWTPSLQQCPKRCNISGYSAEVQRRLSPGYVTETPVVMARDSARAPAPVIRLRPLPSRAEPSYD